MPTDFGTNFEMNMGLVGAQHGYTQARIHGGGVGGARPRFHRQNIGKRKRKMGQKKCTKLHLKFQRFLGLGGMPSDPPGAHTCDERTASLSPTPHPTPFPKSWIRAWYTVHHSHFTLHAAPSPGNIRYTRCRPPFLAITAVRIAVHEKQTTLRPLGAGRCRINPSHCVRCLPKLCRFPQVGPPGRQAILRHNIPIIILKRLVLNRAMTVESYDHLSCRHGSVYFSDIVKRNAAFGL